VDNQPTLNHISANRKALLDELSSRQAIVRNMVRSVARGYATGLYLFGPPGTAKTYTVKQTLDHEFPEVPVYRSGQLTLMGLFDLITENPDKLFVLDHLVSIFKSDNALQILLSALDQPSSRDRDRLVIYQRQGEAVRTVFRGAIICISNWELHDDDFLSAFKSRVHTLNYKPSDAKEQQS
jgi:hypothetical protein